MQIKALDSMDLRFSDKIKVNGIEREFIALHASFQDGQVYLRFYDDNQNASAILVDDSLSVERI